MTEKKKSGQFALGLADCPKCKGKKFIPLGIVAQVGKCDFCRGEDGEPTGKVPLSKQHEFVGLEPITRRDTPSAIKAVRESSIPPKEPDPSKES